MFGRSKIAMLVAEFLGTFILTSIVYTAFLERLPAYFIAGAAAGVVALMVLTVGALADVHLNPAVTIAMWTIRKIETTRAVVYIAAQMLGALAAWRLLEYFLSTQLKSIAGTSFEMRVLVAEGIGTLILTFIFTAAIYQGLRTLRQAVIMGGAFAVGILFASVAGNGLANPAVAAGIRSWSTAYVVGPIIGGLIGANLYAWVFAPQSTSGLAGVVASARARATRATARKTTTRAKTTKRPARRR
ncbi:MAG TPA: aquaporin [Patescibacteria group bacterium]|nr:aquaporin [Patescibacteria group bacterium]